MEDPASGRSEPAAPKPPDSVEPAGATAAGGCSAAPGSDAAFGTAAAVPRMPWRRVREYWHKSVEFVKAFWAKIRPGPEARWGAMVLTALLTTVFGAYISHVARFGLGPVLDVVAGMVAVLIILLLGGLLVALALTIVRAMPRFAAGVLLTAAAVLSFYWPNPAPGTVMVLINAVLGAAIASLVFGGFRRMALARRIVTVALLAIGLAADAALLVLFFGYEGTAANLAKEPKPAPAQRIEAANPADPGPLAVRTLFYGSGTDRRRPEYGQGVQLKTTSVDGSKILKDQTGLRGKFRAWYWGFNTSKLPLNARVWYPDGPGPYPLVLIVHGNHLGQDFSDPGYEYLGRLLASRGYIFASVDENFLNGDWMGDYRGSEQPARGWLLLEHLRLWHEWNRTPGNPFHNKVDTASIALMGHSRGGEAAATAAAFNKLAYFPGDATVRFDYRYNIKSVIAIAPSDGQYMPAGMYRTLKDVNYFVIQGGHDPDVNIFLGSRQYQRASFSEGSPCFKAELYVYEANHGQFNTVWGRTDFGPPAAWVLNYKPLMSGEDQRKIAKVYFTAFLDATLRGRKEYLPMFSDYRRAAAWLPQAIYVNRYQDASYRVVAGYDEDFDVASTTLPGGSISGENLAVWREQRIHFRNGHRETNGVYLGWRKPAAYTIGLPEEFAAKLDSNSVVEFSMADAGEEPPPPDGKKDGKKQEPKKEERKQPLDFTIELIQKSGAAVALPPSALGPLHPQLKAQYAKLKFLEQMGRGGKESEPVLQRYALPLAAFKGLNPAGLKAIRFRFDRSPSGVVVIDDVGFSR